MTRRLSTVRISIVQTIVIWIIQWGLWLLFAANVGLREIMLGAIAAGFATLASVTFASQIFQDFRPRAAWVFQSVRLPWYVLTGTVQVLIALYDQLFKKRGAHSLIEAVPFRVGARNAAATGRRALAITFTTATPNSIVFGILQKDHVLLFHQVRRAKLHGVTRDLGARQ